MSVLGLHNNRKLLIFQFIAFRGDVGVWMELLNICSTFTLTAVVALPENTSGTHSAYGKLDALACTIHATHSFGVHTLITVDYISPPCFTPISEINDPVWHTYFDFSTLYTYVHV